MSRLERLKSRRRKNILKTTASGLALALFIGSTQTIPIYAWFTALGTVDSGLVVNTGTMGLDVTPGFDDAININKETEIITQEFDITNTGSLKQRLSINIDLKETTTIPQSLLNNINYDLELTHTKDDIKYTLDSINGSISTLINDTDINNTDNSQFILDPGTSINCKAKIYINDKNISKNLKGKLLDFDLKIKANQTNLKDNGFMATFSQPNTIAILGDNESEAVWDECPYIGCKKQVIGVDFPKDIYTGSIFFDVDVIGDKDLEVHYVKYGKIYISKKNNSDVTINDILNKNIKVKFRVGLNKYVEYSLSFEKTSSGKVIGIWSYGTTINDLYDIDIEESLKEESEEHLKLDVVGVANELEVAEPPKAEEEIKEPIESEVIEHPKEEVEESIEPELIEQPKVEEVVVSSNPDIIAQKKEETEI